MSLRCLFVVQGEGRGHLTQALALRQLLVTAGHRVEAAVVGQSPERAVPAFFEEKIGAAVTIVDSPSFVPDGRDRSVRPWTSVLHELGRTRTFLRSLETLKAEIERHDPDVVVNFFEPLMGFYAMRYGASVPVVAVAHQYMFLHPAYRFPPGHWIQKRAVRIFARLTAVGASRRLALSLYPAQHRDERDISVVPPLLRSELFEQPTDRTEPFYLIYLLNSGYADEVLRWHEENPGVRLHCFWDRPQSASVERYDDTLTFHQLDGQKFLSMMARCQGVVTTAGFESVAEAMYLGVPVQVVPVKGHFEQYCNALDTVSAGAGIRSSQFDIGRLAAFQSHYRADATRFREWLRGGQSEFVREIEAVASGRDVPVSASPTSLTPAGLPR